MRWPPSGHGGKIQATEGTDQGLWFFVGETSLTLWWSLSLQGGPSTMPHARWAAWCRACLCQLPFSHWWLLPWKGERVPNWVIPGWLGPALERATVFTAGWGKGWSCSVVGGAESWAIKVRLPSKLGGPAEDATTSFQKAWRQLLRRFNRDLGGLWGTWSWSSFPGEQESCHTWFWARGAA